MHRRLVLLLSAVFGLVAVTAAPASAADTVTVPRSAVVTVQGHGHGHGRGMSQYGAEHAARLGKGYRAILSYYYPGTQIGSARESVRVWISRDDTDDVQVAARDGLTARKVGTSTTWNLVRAKPRANRWRIVPAGSGASVLQYRTSTWHRYRKVGGVLELAAGGKPVRLYVRGGSVAYRGALRSVPFQGQRLTVNVVPIESYLRGVVPAETIASRWHQQALRAQAVASRTYAAYQRSPANTYYDLDDTAGNQVYGGASAEYPTTDRAVRATAREIRTYDGAPALAEFTASSGGWTVAGDADKPYLRAVEDQWEWDGDPNRDWTVRFTDREIEQAWPALGNLRSIVITGRDGNGEWGGRAGGVTLHGSRDSKAITAEAFAAKLHLRSTWLDVSARAR